MLPSGSSFFPKLSRWSEPAPSTVLDNSLAALQHPGLNRGVGDEENDLNEWLCEQQSWGLANT